MDEAVEHVGTAAQARKAVRAATMVMVRCPWGIVPVTSKVVLTHCLRGKMSGFEFRWIAYPEGSIQILSADLARKAK